MEPYLYILGLFIVLLLLAISAIDNHFSHPAYTAVREVTVYNRYDTAYDLQGHTEYLHERCLLALYKSDKTACSDYTIKTPYKPVPHACEACGTY